ncbi:MAG: 4-hydroxy-tetrahydrodipicolinate reductase [Clostridia bacterium]|nr:4-hydroxy-tetrahydrodipicolinate reductase [Clostridia bacterium]
MSENMTNVLICGIFSNTGMAVYNAVKDKTDVNVVCGVDAKNPVVGYCDFPVYKSFDEVREAVDLVIDFSSPDMLDEVLSYVTENSCTLIEGTTGYTKKQKEYIRSYGEKASIFMSNYLSLGLDILFKLCFEAAKALGTFDIEIIEMYYRNKINAPGMTTLSLAEFINDATGGNRKIVVGRSSKRKGDEICIHSVRGGIMNGTHEVMFIGEKEVLSVKHDILDTSAYGEAAYDVINFMKGKPYGFFTLKDYYGY